MRLSLFNFYFKYVNTVVQQQIGVVEIIVEKKIVK